MRVICVKSFRLAYDKASQTMLFGKDVPVKDKEYNVLSEYQFSGEWFLVLEGFSVHDGWDKNHFAEIPDSLDEQINEALKAPAPIKREELIEALTYLAKHTDFAFVI